MLFCCFVDRNLSLFLSMNRSTCHNKSTLRFGLCCQNPFSSRTVVERKVSFFSFLHRLDHLFYYEANNSHIDFGKQRWMAAKPFSVASSDENFSSCSFSFCHSAIGIFIWVLFWWRFGLSNKHFHLLFFFSVNDFTIKLFLRIFENKFRNKSSNK